MRRSVALTCAVVFLALVDLAGARERRGVSPPVYLQPAYLRVLLPESDAKLLIDDTPTKQTGKDRLFETPPLDPRRSFTYTVTAKFDPNNYTKVIRTRIVTVQAGREVEVDLRKPDAANPDKFLIRYVPTPEEVVDAMCKLGAVKKGDVVYDLGCGDGRIVITAVRDFGAKRGVGVDIDPERIKDSLANAKTSGVADRLEFRQGDVLNIKDLSDATVVMMYMGEDVNLRLMPILKKSLKPGSRIVSHDFKMGDWKPDGVIQITDSDGDEHELYLWTIPGTPQETKETKKEPGQPTTARIQKRTYDFKEAGKEMEYALFVPSKYDKTQKTPLMVALHGLGSTPQQIMRYRGLTDLAEKHGYIVAAPMGYNSSGWYGSRGPTGKGEPKNLGELSEKDVMNVLALVRKEFNVDENRIYLMGHSMGGGGTWHLGLKYPDLWAGLAPIAPAIFRKPDELDKIKHIPVIVVQGDQDKLVPVAGARRWVERMKELKMTHEYLEIAGGGHVDIAFTGMPKIFEFFNKHAKKAK